MSLDIYGEPYGALQPAVWSEVRPVRTLAQPQIQQPQIQQPPPVIKRIAAPAAQATYTIDFSDETIIVFVFFMLLMYMVYLCLMATIDIKDKLERLTELMRGK